MSSRNTPAPGFVSLVTGGSRGLGLALVEGLLEAGGRVATFSRSATPEIDRLAADPAYTDRFMFARIDMRDAAGAGAFVRAIRDRFGRLDALVNNAGIALDGVHGLFADEAIDDVLDVNLRAPLKLTRHAVRQMLTQREGGRIVNISSIIGVRGYRGLVTYSATKAALDGMTRALARELGDRGILVNSIAPGYLRTTMTHGLDAGQSAQIVRRTPLRRLGEPGDVVPLLLFLCSDGARFITGQTFVVDGGLTT
jgi:3-oxoacyl-[acyl-carrier protein] reductase